MQHNFVLIDECSHAEEAIPIAKISRLNSLVRGERRQEEQNGRLGTKKKRQS